MTVRQYRHRIYSRLRWLKRSVSVVDYRRVHATVLRMAREGLDRELLLRLQHSVLRFCPVLYVDLSVLWTLGRSD